MIENIGDIQVYPPRSFDGRRFEDWTLSELIAATDDLSQLATEACGAERDRLLQKESDVMRCLGYLMLMLGPSEGLIKEWHAARAAVYAAEDLSSDHIAALTRVAEVQRACGLELLGFARKYMYGREPLP